MKKLSFFLIAVLMVLNTAAQEKVNVFLGTSGDHGQLSPAASYPFSMLDIGPQTYPNTHTGYEHKAKVFLGFTHGRLEGVGCRGSGGNLLIKPIAYADTTLIKKSESGNPGYYAVRFTNGIRCQFTLAKNSGIEVYHFPAGKHGLSVDLAHALMNGFVAEEHQTTRNGISGWVESHSTCKVGTYRTYYAIRFDQPVTFSDTTAHRFSIRTMAPDLTLRIAFSSVSVAYAGNAISKSCFWQTQKSAKFAWHRELGRIGVMGDPTEKALFESLLYRCLHAPFDLTEADGSYRGSDGLIHHTDGRAYSGWTIWDNYKTTLPLLSIIAPDRYQDIVTSIDGLYKSGKKNWATKTEPCNTVRTEHAMVVLLDAYRKGYRVDFNTIIDSLIAEGNRLDFSKPDKALESSYDCWALAQILDILHQDGSSWLAKAAHWKTYWEKDFKDLSRVDVDDLNARHMYQGTIWQYRWFAPFDQKGLMDACGGEKEYTRQLDEFFDQDYYNAANEPDIQVPYMFNFTTQPWKSQNIIRKYAADTVIQYYYDDNYRGINPTIDRAYNNRPDGFIMSMDDDMGAMSAWYVLAAIGLSPACVGYPVYYLHVPLFKTITIGRLHIMVNGKGRYIRSVQLNKKAFERNWLSQQEIMTGGTLIINAEASPNKNFGIHHQFITSLDNENN